MMVASSGLTETTTRTAPIPVTVDVVLFSIRPTDNGKRALHVLLVKRAWEPFADHWALPGDYVGLGEPLSASAARALTEKTGLRPTYLEQLYTFGRPDRGAKERVITVAYYALARADEVEAANTWHDDTVKWWPVDCLPASPTYDRRCVGIRTFMASTRPPRRRRSREDATRSPARFRPRPGSPRPRRSTCRNRRRPVRGRRPTWPAA